MLSKDNIKNVAIGLLVIPFFPLLALIYVVWTGGKLARDVMENGF